VYANEYVASTFACDAAFTNSIRQIHATRFFAFTAPPSFEDTTQAMHSRIYGAVYSQNGVAIFAEKYVTSSFASIAAFTNSMKENESYVFFAYILIVHPVNIRANSMRCMEKICPNSNSYDRPMTLLSKLKTFTPFNNDPLLICLGLYVQRMEELCISRNT
jgi:hypothetical protein